MTIPGFKGTPKYDGFFGSLPGGTKGGFAGERPVPTEADITAAKQKLTHVLTASLENSMTSKRSADLAVVGGAWKVSVTRMSVNTTTDEQGNFSVFGEATFTAIGFREGDLKESLLALAAKDHPDAAFRAFEVSYGALAPDFAKGELRLPVNVKATLVPRFSADDFKMSVAGKNVRDVQTAVLALPGLSEGAVSVWPRFRSSVPTETDRIRVVVE